jgi:hypothetical protein
MRTTLLALCILLGTISARNAEAASRFGRFVGTLTHDKLKREQLAKLDFVASRDDNNTLVLNAVLTLHFGDFKSGEYTTYHYKNVRYNVLQGTLVFDDTGQSLSLITSKFDITKGEIEADVRSIWSGNVGKLVVKRDGTANPTLPLIEPVWGEYKSECSGQRQVLQLYTSKSTEDLGHLGEPYSAYSIVGQFGTIGGSIPVCHQNNGCNSMTVVGGSYNFFTQDLSLIGLFKNLSCKVGDNEFVCGACTFKRVSDETKPPRAMQPPTSPVAFPSFAKSVPVNSGEYKGYVHHEYLNAYQFGSVNLAYFQIGGSSGLKISASAKLYFGDEASPEVIPYRFAETAYPNPLAPEQVVVLQNTDSDVDAVLQITSAEKDVIRGVWYSLIFGRVGTFEFRKTGLPPLPAGADVLGPISGDYESTNWDMEIKTALGVKPPNSTSNPFFPNIFSGGVRMKNGLTKRLRILDGSYDFYTGRIGITREFSNTSTEDGNSLLLGKRRPKEILHLNSSRSAIISPLPSHNPVGYRKIPTKGE